MKHKLLALLAVIGMVAAFAPPSAFAVSQDMTNDACFPYPYYGCIGNSVQFVAPGTGNNAGAYIDVSSTVSANYTTYASTWQYPSPGIPYHWLETWSVTQYSDAATAPPDNGTDNGDGNCVASWGSGTGHIANDAGAYSTNINGAYGFGTVMSDCYHHFVRIRVESSFNPGNFGWKVIKNWSPWRYNPYYTCIHLHEPFTCTETH